MDKSGKSLSCCVEEMYLKSSVGTVNVIEVTMLFFGLV